MFGKILSTLVAGLAVASAYTTPVGKPEGNPIRTPSLAQIVPVGSPFKITWDPTTPTTGTVTLVLLRGPSDNVKPLEVIVEKTANTGSYTWTPPTTLDDDTLRYGIQLIVDATGQYQYSTQFGVSNPARRNTGGSTSGSMSSTASGSMTSGSAIVTSSSRMSNSTIVITSSMTSATLTAGNSTLRTTATLTTPSVPRNTTLPVGGGAGQLLAGFGGAAVAIVAAVAAL